MRAPVYRHLDSQNGLFGLSVLEWAPIPIVAWVGMVEDRPNQAVIAAAIVYAVLRVMGHGRPEGFLRHFLLWRGREQVSRGRFCAGARMMAPEFPFAEFDWPEEAVRQLESIQPGRKEPGSSRAGARP